MDYILYGVHVSTTCYTAGLDTHPTFLVTANLLLLLAFFLHQFSSLLLYSSVWVKAHHDTQVLQRVPLQYMPLLGFPETKQCTHV